MEYDLHNSIKQEVAIDLAAAAGASTVGNTIDTRGFESMEYVITSGTITTGDFTLLLEQAEDDPANPGTPLAFTTVSSDLVLGPAVVFAVTDDDVAKRQGTISKARFQRLTLLGANTPVGEFSAVAVLGHPQTRPTAD